MRQPPAPTTRGYVLIIVAVALMLIATTSLSLFARSADTAHHLTSQYELEQLQYALDAGVAHGRAALYENSSCSGYLPLTGNLGNASYAVTYSSNSGSPVTATVTATHAGGSSRTTDIELQAYSGPVTVTLDASADTDLRERTPDDNQGNSNTAHSVATDNNRDEHAIMQFDFAPLPALAHVVTAVLNVNLKNSSTDNDPDTVYRIAQNWVEDQATWRKYQSGFFSFWLAPGGYYNLHAWARFDDSIVGPQSATITDLVRLWHAGLPNYGVLLRADFHADSSHKHYSSKEDGNAASRPNLTVTYRCDCTTGC